MKKVIMLMIILLFSPSCSSKAIKKDIEIDSIVSSCIDIKKDKIEKYGNIVILNTLWDVKSSIGECGCKSAALGYQVKIERNLVISTGILTTPKRNSFKFVINSDNEIYSNEKYKLVINCQS